MYLIAKIHLSISERATDEVQQTLSALFPEVPCIESVHAVIGDWRKANAIHAWFVKHLQDGRDDCGHYEVSRSILAELLAIVNEVLEHPSRASTLLPTTDGRFFGSTLYDDLYFENIKYTKRVLEHALSPKMNHWYFQYHASW